MTRPGVRALMSMSRNPYGDGQASGRIVEDLKGA